MSYEPSHLIHRAVDAEALSMLGLQNLVGVDRKYTSEQIALALRGKPMSLHMTTRLRQGLVFAHETGILVTVFGPGIVYDDQRIRDIDDAARLEIDDAQSGREVGLAYTDAKWRLLTIAKPLLRLIELEDRQVTLTVAEADYLPSHRYVSAIALFTLALLAQKAVDVLQTKFQGDTEAVDFDLYSQDIPSIQSVVDCIELASRLMLDVEMSVAEVERKGLPAWRKMARADRTIVHFQLASVGALARDLVGYPDDVLRALAGDELVSVARARLGSLAVSTSSCLQKALGLLSVYPSAIFIARNLAYMGLQEGNATVARAAAAHMARLLSLPDERTVWATRINGRTPLCEEPTLRHLFDADNVPGLLSQ